VITAGNPVHALLYLILSLLCGHDFCPRLRRLPALEIVYAGAIVVAVRVCVDDAQPRPACGRAERQWLTPVSGLARRSLGAAAGDCSVLLFQSGGATIGLHTIDAKAVGVTCAGLTCWRWSWLPCCCWRCAVAAYYHLGRHVPDRMMRFPCYSSLGRRAVQLGLIGLMVRRNILFVLMSLE
jgi:NADH-quinone oxidoreductase subunit J